MSRLSLRSLRNKISKENDRRLAIRLGLVDSEIRSMRRLGLHRYCYNEDGTVDWNQKINESFSVWQRHIELRSDDETQD